MYTIALDPSTEKGGLIISGSNSDTVFITYDRITKTYSYISMLDIGYDIQPILDSDPYTIKITPK